MTDNELKIRFKNQRQFFEISEDEIRIELDTVKHKLKYNISLDDIQNSWYIENGGPDSKTNLLYISAFFNVLFLLALISELNDAPKLGIYMLLSLTLLPLLLFFKWSSEAYEEKHIGSSKVFYFIYTPKTAAEVDRFISLVYQKQKDFFKRKYFIVDPVLPYNVQHERYLWLYTNKYINENEYEVIKEDLDRLFNFNPTI